MKHSKETKQRISASLKGRESPAKGKHWNEESRMKISEKIHLGLAGNIQKKLRKMRESYRYRITDESRKKMSKNRRGKLSGKDNPHAKCVICINTGKVYDTIKSAAEDTGANQFKISDVCRGARKHTSGLRFKYAD